MESTTLRLAFTGDVCLGPLADLQEIITELPDWPSIKQAIGPHDFLVGNLECCLVDERCNDDACSQPMAVPTDIAEILRTSGFTDLNLANNHMLDCGSQAIDVTRQRLDELNIRMFGAGANRREAEEISYAQQGKHTVAFLGACDVSEYYANDRRAGIASITKDRLGPRVRTAAANADLVVVILHADLEFSEVPGMWRQRLSRWLVDQGAHLVIQHHPHVLQGIETYHGGLIAYSLGNFMFWVHGNTYQENKAGVFDSAVLVVEAELGSNSPALKSRVIPLRIGREHLPRILAPADHVAAEQRFQRLSALLCNPRKHRALWFQRCRKEAIGRLYRLYYALHRRDFRRIRSELRWLLTRREDHRWLLGLISFGYL